MTPLLLAAVLAAAPAAPPNDFTVDWSTPRLTLEERQAHVEMTAATGLYPDGVLLQVQFYPLRQVIDWTNRPTAADPSAAAAPASDWIRVETAPARDPARWVRAEVRSGQLFLQDSIPLAVRYEIVTYFSPDDNPGDQLHRYMHRDYRVHRYRFSFPMARAAGILGYVREDAATLRAIIQEFGAFTTEISGYLAAHADPGEEEYRPWLERWVQWTVETRTKLHGFLLTGSADAMEGMIDSFHNYVVNRGHVVMSPTPGEGEGGEVLALRYGLTGEYMTPQRAAQIAGSLDGVAARESAFVAASLLCGLYEEASAAIDPDSTWNAEQRQQVLDGAAQDQAALSEALAPEQLGPWAPVFEACAFEERPDRATIRQLAGRLQPWLQDARAGVAGDVDASDRALAGCPEWNERLARLLNRIRTGTEEPPPDPNETEGEVPQGDNP